MNYYVPAPGRWLPIDTLPENYGVVDIFSTEFKRVCNVIENSSEDGRTFVELMSYEAQDVADATHWMPRPEDPFVSLYYKIKDFSLGEWVRVLDTPHVTCNLEIVEFNEDFAFLESEDGIRYLLPSDTDALLVEKGTT